MIIALQTLLYFRQSLLTVLDRLLSPYYKRLTLTFSRCTPDDDEDEEEVYAEFDDEKGVVFFPPMYAQRYAAVSDCLMDDRWCGKLDKVVDLGYHDMSFIKYLKELPGVRCILGVDIESIPLRCSSDLLGCDEYAPKREHPLQVTLFQGNAADPDYRLIGCDAVVAIEMIEHMLPHDLDRLVHTVFGFIKPWIAIFTTPNGDFNVLFKSLEKNGLRRLDHFFEWSREQFHDWCSNIVTRYPQFSVTCQGIGPGPPGTYHHGCCSQLALFVNKAYVKQHDLNLNSLALVSNVPSPQNVAELVGGWESPMPDTENIMCPQETMESLTDILYSTKQSCVTIVITSPGYSIAALQYSDKMSQCNLDTEQAKNFLMFNDEEMCFSVLVPRRKLDNKVYEIEDVASRLNCTTFQVKKFSKTTQNLMAKNRIDSLVHTREVVSEIRHLTKMLNFNTKDALTERGEQGYIWCNINWGENAPYWNQYYTVVKEYSYPFETKSDECRIMDLISEEINRLVDAQCNEDKSATEVDKIEIPIAHLMRIVSHITDDEAKVKDLLEWNGYEVMGNIVIHTRMVVDNISTGSCDDEWPENDTVSDLESTDIHSTTISDGSTLAPDHHGRCFRRALDKKVRALRAMLSADEDITTELDRVVCRLMKLALRTSKGKQAAPPTRWMQCKLLDLLTLTEKAISRRKRHYLENLALKAIAYEHSQTNQFVDMVKMKRESPDVTRIVDKYNYLLENDILRTFDPLEFGYEDDLGDASKDMFKDFSLNDLRFSTQMEIIEGLDREFSPEDIPDWVDKDPMDDIHNIDQTTKTLSSSDLSSSNFERYRKKKQHKRIEKPKDGDKKIRKTIYEKIEDVPKQENKQIAKKSKTSLRKVSRNKSTTNTKVYTKKPVNDFGTYGLKPKRLLKEYKKLQPTASKPIPSSLLELCHPELMQTNAQEYSYTKRDSSPIKTRIYSDIAAAEESVLIDIVMDDMAETIALRKSIGTDPDMDVAAVEQELVSDIGKVATVVKNDSLHNKLHTNSDSVQSQTIFIYDINEPSTSKGVRHVSMDVQCGTDTVMPPYGMVTPPASVTRMPKMFSNGIKIEDSMTNITSRNNSFDLGSSKLNHIQNFGPVCNRIRSPTMFSKGIKIEDSLDNMTVKKNNSDFGTSTNEETPPKVPRTARPTRIRIKDSLSEMKPKNSDVETTTNDRYGNLSPKRKCSGINFNVISEQNDIFETRPRTRSPTKINTGIRKRDSMSDVRSRKSSDFGMSRCDIVEECITISPRSKSPDIFSGIKVDDSLTNVLASFNASAEYTDSSRPISPRTIMRGRGMPLINSPENVETNDFSMSVDGSKEKNIFISVTESPGHIIKNPSTGSTTTCRSSRIMSPRTRSPTTLKCRGGSSLLGVKMSETSDVGTCTFDKYKVVKKSKNTDSGTNTNNLEISDYGTYTENKLSESNVDLKSTQVNEMISADVSGNQNNLLTLRTRCFGFKVKDIDENLIKKVEFSTTRAELLSDGNTFLPNQLPSSTKTETLKPVSSAMKTEDSEFGSELCSYSCTSPKSPVDFGGVSRSRSRDVEVKESPTMTMKRKLSCGGVHVHSYKEKQSSEDIVYQGEWQRPSPRPPRKQLSQVNPVLSKKTTELVAKKLNSKKTAPKEQKFTKNTVKKLEIKVEPKKTVQVRNSKAIKAKQDTINADKIRKVTLPSLVKVVKVNSKNLTKVASKIGTSYITSRNARNPRIPKMNVNITSSPLKKDCDVKPNRDSKNGSLRKSYLPAYLKRRKFITEQYALNQSLDSAKKSFKMNNVTIAKDIMHIPRPNVTAGINSDLIKIQNSPIDSISYVVFRNELENNMNSNNGQSAENSNRTNGSNKRMNISKRSSSPMSVTSSTCSTPDSVATVRIKSTFSKQCSRRHSTSSNKSSIATTDSETAPTTNRNRKLIKRGKINKKDHSNKENIPETSKLSCANDECLQNVKSAFFGRNKNVFMAQFATDSGVTLNNKHVATKSNIKIPAIDNNDEKKRPRTATISHRKSSQFENASYDEELKKQDSNYSDNSNKVILINDRSKVKVQESSSPSLTLEPDVKVVDSSLLAEWLESVSVAQKISTESAILAAMRQIVDERLDSINYLESQHTSFEDCFDVDDTASLKSYKTVVPSDDAHLNSTLKSEIENAMNHSFEAITTGESTGSLGDESDIDLLSFKSVTSVSKFSEYFAAESKHKITDKMQPQPVAHNNLSVQDIFERKELSLMQKPPGALAIQAFSGFSMNVDPVVGDQPDYVNLIDSETGSMAMDIGRQATSEELFVSGRSSESYESCLIEEDAVVPNWLFQIISQQHSLHEEENNIQELVPLAMPLAEPVFDVNGNVMEPNVGLGAGAGDGRGMHSDHSQDSSGRGSSLSTTDTSSGQQSEAILIDPSAFTTQFEIHEPIGSSMAVTTLVVPSEPPDSNRQGGNDAEPLSTSRNEARRVPPNPLLTSDGEADVSSLDTDVPDSSDN